MILVLNCGSQSIKWKIFNEKMKLLDEGKKTVVNKNEFKQTLEEELGKIDRTKITLVGHRVVHGGRTFVQPLKIGRENIEEIEKLNHLAPLHNPYNVLGIKVCQELFPSILQFAVFDTEFFKDIPVYVKNYALPQEIVKGFGFERFGFHGISHEYVAKKAAEKLKKPLNKLKMITCHLGGGCSISAIENGKAIDTSMGFTPMQGLIMMTRVGDVDAGIVLELVKNFGVEKTSTILNKESGVLGISGEAEMLNVLSKVKEGDKKAQSALDMFVYAVKKYIGAYYAILGKCDVLVFTGSIGSGSAKIRNMICKDLNILKKSKVLAIETNEELAIAQKIYQIAK